MGIHSFSDAWWSQHQVIQSRLFAGSAAHSKFVDGQACHLTQCQVLFPAVTTTPSYPTLARWQLRRHTGSRVRCWPRQLLCRSTGRLVKKRRQPSCSLFSMQRHESCQTAASTIEDWPISGAMFYTGWMSLTGLGSGCASRCTSVNTVWLLDTWSISAIQSPALTVADIRNLQSVVRCSFHGSRRQPTETVLLDIYLERCVEHSQMQFTLFTYFRTSSKTFLLFVLLAHQVHSKLLQLQEIWANAHEMRESL